MNTDLEARLRAHLHDRADHLHPADVDPSVIERRSQRRTRTRVGFVAAMCLLTVGAISTAALLASGDDSVTITPADPAIEEPTEESTASITASAQALLADLEWTEVETLPGTIANAWVHEGQLRAVTSEDDEATVRFHSHDGVEWTSVVVDVPPADIIIGNPFHSAGVTTLQGASLVDDASTESMQTQWVAVLGPDGALLRTFEVETVGSGYDGWAHMAYHDGVTVLAHDRAGERPCQLEETGDVDVAVWCSSSEIVGDALAAVTGDPLFDGPPQVELLRAEGEGPLEPVFLRDGMSVLTLVRAANGFALLLMAPDNELELLTSTDGLEWTERVLPANTEFVDSFAVSEGGEEAILRAFVRDDADAEGLPQPWFSDDDGVTWVRDTDLPESAFDRRISNVGWFAMTFEVSVGAGIEINDEFLAFSPDGRTWVETPLGDIVSSTPPTDTTFASLVVGHDLIAIFTERFGSVGPTTESILIAQLPSTS